MKRWRPLTWLLLSLACFIAAFYFWRLGDKWQAARPAAPAASAASAASAPASPSLDQFAAALPKGKIVTVKSSSIAPVVDLHPPATKAVTARPTNAFPYRLSNTTQSIGELSHNNKAILLENALIDNGNSSDLAIPDSLRAHGDPGSYIVQFSGPITDAFRAELKTAGATIVSYIPNNAYLVRASAAAVAQIPNTTATAWQPYFKVKASMMRKAIFGQSVPAATVAVFSDAVDDTRSSLLKMGVQITSESPSPFGTVMTLKNVSNLATLAGLPGIEEIEPTATRIRLNDLTRVLTAVSSDVFTNENYLNLTGSNVLVAVNDSWEPTNGATIFNPDLLNIFSPFVGVNDFEGHATHVAGIIAASGMNSPSNAVGSQVGADFRGKASLATIWAMPLDGTTDADLQQADVTTNALISNNSWGYNITDYDLACASYDQAVRDALPGATGSQPLLMVFAAGNSGNGGDDGLGGDPGSILSPASAKNVVTVGASELPRNITNLVSQCDACDTTVPCTTNAVWQGMTDSSNEVARFSSRGNVGIGVEGDQGRFKPDVIAPGTFVVSTRSITWDTNAYYNPQSVFTETFLGAEVTTNNPFNDTIDVPCDAVQLSIFADALEPGINMPIFVQVNAIATPTSFLVAGTNNVNLPPDAPLAPTDTTWFYRVIDPTNVPVVFDDTVELVLTNGMGDYFDVLRTNLNDLLVTSNGTGPFYRYESGTSMAAPAVSGQLALMEDFSTNRWGYRPSPALMKALVINGARTLSEAYDFQVQSDINFQGWGLINLTNSLPAAITNSFGQAAPMLFTDQNPTNALATGDSRTVFVTVDPSAQNAPLRVTLVWTDPPGNPAASIKLVNNLDLIVTNLDTTNGAIYFGNDILSGNTFNEPFDTTSTNGPNVDNVNNVENIYIGGQPLGTNYSITVVARNVNVNAVTQHTNGVVQDYALVISSDNGEITNALTLTNAPIISSDTITLTTVTNQFPNSPDTSGGLLLNQHVGASSPLQGTNTLSLDLVNDPNWGTNGQITLGVNSQWHFYVISNIRGPNATADFTNAAFATFLPPNLSIPPVGVDGSVVGFSTRPEADIDLYVARGSKIPNASDLTNLNATVIAAADKSLSRGGTETLTYTDAAPNEVFYIGVKSEDQEAAEYGFLALFALEPFSQQDSNGVVYMHGINVPTPIPDGSPQKPGIARTIALAVQPVSVRRVVVTNFMEHQNFGDLAGTLMHSQQSAVLNNHTFGNGTTNQEFIYEDNGEGDIPGSQHTDGPGTLRNFVGQQGLGLWMLQEVDSALNHTGQVDDLFIRLDPQQGTNGVLATIPPNSFFYDFIDVPPEATNLTIRVDIISGTGPVQLYVRRGDFPTQTTFDYAKVINAPGDSLTIDRTSLPPLEPGRYFVGIFNPNASAQTIRLSWTFGLDIHGVTPTPITTTNASTPLLDDAVTNSTIFITNQQNIVQLDVGVVIDHPRVSDLDLTLISPWGQRILLFEDRGGPSATNMGHLNIKTNFFGTTSAGGAIATNNTIGPVPTSGLLLIDYNFFTVPDQMDVYYDGVDIFHSGYLSGSGTFSIPYGPGVGTTISIVMNQGNNPNTTAWIYTPRVVSEDFTYLAFTDDTNRTQIPIKFAIPPYDNLDNGTNFTLSDFEMATNGDYLAAPTNFIPDTNGGWVLNTNGVFVRTNFFGPTNLLSMASNQVSVVTDPFNAGGGSNFLALANGSISRVISTIPARNYTISYLFRGPGIAGWWRGEGDASDSADPETLGNNGGLIGRFNFPAGEVGQAFALEDSGLAFDFAGTNTYVQVRQSASLNVGTGSGFTVEGWINPTNTTFQQPLVEWLAPVPTNSVVNGQNISNLVIEAGPFLNPANGHYYYLLAQTNWTTSELWANALGGHLAEIDDENEQNWVYDTFAQFGLTNHTMWIGLTNSSTTGGTNLVWSTGNSNIVYTNWDAGQPTNCPNSIYVAMMGPTNTLPGLWDMLDNNGLSCTGVTNKPFGVVEVNNIQTNGVQFWISVTNLTTPGNGRLYANIVDTNNVSHEIFSAPGLIQSNVFQHVALTYNTNTEVAQLFYNGVIVATTNFSVGSTNIIVPQTGGDVLLGKDLSRITNNFFWGLLDEMSIYSRFLSDSEIASIYNISASTTNRNTGKFDPEITPSESLAEAQVSLGSVTNVLYGPNQGWQEQGFSFQSTSNSVPLQFTGIEPGVLLDSVGVSVESPANLYYLPEQPLQAVVGSNAFGPWTLEIRDSRTGAVSTNALLVSWQLDFILQTNTSLPVVLSPQTPATNTVPPGEIAIFQVNVPSWAKFATNLVLSSANVLGGGSQPVDLLFNQLTPPTGGGGDTVLIANQTAPPTLIGNPVLAANPFASVPPLLPGQTYYLGVRNNGTTPASVAVEVDFNIMALTNGVPFTSGFGTNDVEQPYVFNVSSNASEATFELLQLTGNADLVLRKGLPLPSLLSADYGSFAGSNSDEIIYVLTNSLPVPLSAGPWYLDVIKRVGASDTGSTGAAMRYAVLAKELDAAPNIITLSNRVPITFTAGPGAELTNFFKFTYTNFVSPTATNLDIRFELFNQNGNGDLTVQTNGVPLAPPFFQSSRLPGNQAEIIFIRTNSSLPSLTNDWYFGVPNNETNPLTYTILATIDTNTFASFPTAEGSGGTTRGGSFGTNVYHVVNLNDSGPGSLRNGVTSSNTSTIVFDVSGTITLNSPLYITNSAMTIAGQTAPGGAITVVGATTYVENAHDIILRYLRFRGSSTNAVVWSSSFENGSGDNTFFAGSHFAEGWLVNSGSIDQLNNGSPFFCAPIVDGNYLIDINGNNPGVISTNIPTVAGTTYSLSFAYTPNPSASSPIAAVVINGAELGRVNPNYANAFTNLNWQMTSFVFTATSPSTALAFVSTNTPGAAGVLLDDVILSISGLTNEPDALQFTNVTDVIADHVSTAYSTHDLISVLNSSNVTVQWSVLAESQNKTDSLHGGSQVRYGIGDVTYHHNLYADDYSANPRLGDNVSLDFVNNVIFNWGAFAGLTTNDIADDPAGFTNFLNYSANYLIAYTNSVFTNVAFWGGTTNTWIFQTNNFIDTNENSIHDGADTSWGMFSNQFTEFTHPFAIPPTAPDEAFIAYERVLDFAGTSLAQRDLTDRGIVQRVRLQPANGNTNTLLSGMVAWWKAEGTPNDSVGGNNGTITGGVSYTNGEVNQAFKYDGTSGYISVPASASLNVGTGGGFTIEGWIKPDHLGPVGGEGRPIVEWDGPSQIGVVFYFEAGSTLYGDVRDTAGADHTVQTAANTISTNALQHVAFTWDRASGNTFLYVNGVQLASASYPGINPQTSFPVSLGIRATPGFAGSGDLYNGLMDEMSIYNRALSQCEIVDIYNSSTNGKTPLLISATNGGSLATQLYLDTDQDGIPDFWEITLGEFPTNASSTFDRDGDGYTDLEEYLNWLGAPHALTVTNTPVNVDLYVLAGNTGNLTFGVANGTNGTVFLTNSCSGAGNHIAVFTPTNNFGNGSNGGFGSFTFMVTNTDTVAYFGPVTVSVFASAVPITNATLAAFTFTNPPDILIFQNTTNTVLNQANPTNGITYFLLNPPPWATINTNSGLITLAPGNCVAPTNVTIFTVAQDTNVPPDYETNFFNVTVVASNYPPVFFNPNPPNITNSALAPIVVTNAAFDPDCPAQQLLYDVCIAPYPPGTSCVTNASIDTNGVISWTPTLGQEGLFQVTTIATDYEPAAVNTPTNLMATNFFYIFVTAPIAPFAFTQPAQAVTGSSAQLNGMATPNGLPTMVWFEWGTNTAYGSVTPPVTAGSSFNVVYTTGQINALAANVPYHFRLVASNIFGVTRGFDQVLDEAYVVGWGADYVGQINVPSGLSNVVSVVGAYDHSLALRNNETALAWGDNTFNQTNIPAALNHNLLALAGGQYYSMALRNNNTVFAWGGNILGQTNVPPNLSNVVMIAGGTYASLALQGSGNVVAWGANLLNVTNVPASLSNVVEVAGGSYHSLAIRNDGTVAVWGDNSAGQTNVPPTATNVVAIAGGNYHSLALRADGTVVAWGDNSAGQTNVPANLSNVVAVAAGGFHSLALRSDGSIVAWGDDSAGQTSVPLGLSNVVAITSGYFHNLALSPTLISTNLIIVPITNGSPDTNTLLGGEVAYYQVNVPANVDFTTNTLIYTVSGSLNVWFTTNSPPTVTNLNDVHLMTNSTAGTNVLSTNTTPFFIPGATYYLGVQNTNSFSVTYGIEVDFHFVAASTNTVPISSITPTNSGGTNGFLLVWYAPTNDLFQVQWTSNLLSGWTTFTNIVGYDTNLYTNNPTSAEFDFLDDGSQTGGTLGTMRFYRLILLSSTNAPAPPATNTVPISSITPTNSGGTNSFLLVWFAPTNDLFKVQWSSNLPPTWTTFPNVIGYDTNLYTNNPNSTEFDFLDNGSETGGSLGPVRFYRLILLNSSVSSGVIPLTNGIPLNFTTGGGLTNFFSFDITQTNAAVLFELYNLSGNGDLTLQFSNLPTTPPYFRSSTNSGTNFEQIVIRTNNSVPNLNAISWFLGVPNQTSNSVSYTIRAALPTNGILVSGLPFSAAASRPGGSNVQLVWGPLVTGETYEVRTNSNIASTNWGALTDIVASGTSITFVDPNSTSWPTLFYRVVQVP